MTTARPFWPPATCKVSPFQYIPLFFISTMPYQWPFNFTCPLHPLLTRAAVISMQLIITLTCLAQHFFCIICPLWSNSNLVPHEAEACRVITVISLRAHKELSASPRKPNVSTDTKSENTLSLDVWCLRAKKKKLLPSYGFNYNSLLL